METITVKDRHQLHASRILANVMLLLIRGECSFVHSTASGMMLTPLQKIQMPVVGRKLFKVV